MKIVAKFFEKKLDLIKNWKKNLGYCVYIINDTKKPNPFGFGFNLDY
jgi:hypothetical protein